MGKSGLKQIFLLKDYKNSRFLIPPFDFQPEKQRISYTQSNK
jgi:hypothetical protein